MARHENWLPLQPDLNPSDLGLSDQRRGGQWFGTLSTHGLSDKIQHDPRSRGGETGTPGDSLRLGGAKRPEDDNERKRSRKKEQERLLAMSESSAAMLARVLHKKGGCILVVGGGVSDFRLPDHPQILLWDEEKMNLANKDIPTNTRAILWTRKISHAQQDRMNVAVEKYHILKFPFQKVHEIRYLLSEIKPYTEMVTESDSTSAPTPRIELREEVTESKPITNTEVIANTEPIATIESEKQKEQVEQVESSSPSIRKKHWMKLIDTNEAAKIINVSNAVIYNLTGKGILTDHAPKNPKTQKHYAKYHVTQVRDVARIWKQKEWTRFTDKTALELTDILTRPKNSEPKVEKVQAVATVAVAARSKAPKEPGEPTVITINRGTAQLGLFERLELIETQVARITKLLFGNK